MKFRLYLRHWRWLGKWNVLRRRRRFLCRLFERCDYFGRGNLRKIHRWRFAFDRCDHSHGLNQNRTAKRGPDMPSWRWFVEKRLRHC